MGLMFGDNSRAITRGELMDVPTPAGTRTHRPIPHGQFVDRVLGVLEGNGFRTKPDSIDLAISKDGSNVFGAIQPEGLSDGTMRITLGLRNSHSKQFSAGVVGGEQITACDNLAFSGQLVTFRKHTLRILDEIDERIESLAKRLPGFRSQTQSKIDWMKGRDLGVPDGHHLIIQAAAHGACRVRDILPIAKEWERPTFDEFQGRTVWTLYNAFTHVGRSRWESSPEAASESTMRLNKLLCRQMPEVAVSN